MNLYHVIRRAGAELWLLPDKAIYWPRKRAFLVANMRIGKTAVYRRLGQPVPHGTTERNLARPDAAIMARRTGRLIVLGDFLHDPNRAHRRR